MKSYIAVLTLVSTFYSPVGAQDLASAAPFRIDIQTDAADNYQYSYLSADSAIHLGLNQGSGEESYYLGVDASTQFAAKILGLGSNYNQIVRGYAGMDFALASTGYSGQLLGEVYLGRMEGLRPVFTSATTYSLEQGKELISASITGYDFDDADDAAGTQPVGFVAAQYSPGAQPATLFVWDAERDEATAVTQIEVPSFQFEHSGSSFYSAYFDSESYRFQSSVTGGDLKTKTFVAYFDSDLELTTSYTVDTAVGSDITWQALYTGSSTERSMLSGSRSDPLSFVRDGGYASLIGNSGNVQWTRHYTHNGDAFFFLTHSGEWNNEIYLTASKFLPTGGVEGYLIVVNPDTGAVLRAFDMNVDGESLTVSRRIGSAEKFVLYGDDEAFLYATADNNFTNGKIHRLSVDVPNSAEVSGWYYSNNLDQPFVNISSYNATTSKFQTWLAVEGTCDIFETDPFSLSSVTINSTLAQSPLVTAVAVNTSQPTVNLVVETLALPAVIEEPSSRVSECFGGGSIGATYWFDNANEIQPAGWLYFDWFKGFKPEGANWIYHGRHGWLYVLADDTSGMFLWDVALGRWMFTNETAYPWMYAYGPGGGWMFFFEGGSPGSRYFKRGDNGTVVSEQVLGAK